MNKQSQLIFLSTERTNNPTVAKLNREYAGCANKQIGDLIIWNNECDGNWSPCHLYIFSDDEIKEGDWYIQNNRSIHKANDGIESQLKSNQYYGIEYKKIIATTNPELFGIADEGVATILQSDIKYIISLYNGKEEEVDVEKLLEDEINRINGNIPEDWLDQNVIHWFKKGGRFGYNQCLQDNADKRFTLEDARKIFEAGGDNINSNYGGQPINDNAFDKIIQSLTKEQPAGGDTVMVEYIKPNGFFKGLEPQPKLKDGNICIVR